MSRKGESITLSLTTEEKAELELIALQHGRKWGAKPNVSALLKAIANRKLIVIDPDLTMGPVKSDRLKAIARRRHEAIEKIQQGLTELGESF